MLNIEFPCIPLTVFNDFFFLLLYLPPSIYSTDLFFLFGLFRCRILVLFLTTVLSFIHSWWVLFSQSLTYNISSFSFSPLPHPILSSLGSLPLACAEQLRLLLGKSIPSNAYCYDYYNFSAFKCYMVMIIVISVFFLFV